MQIKLQKLGRFYILSLLGFIFWTTGCKKGPDFLKPYGEDAQKMLSFPGKCLKFSVGQKFKVYITSDTLKPEQITVSYGSNLLEKITLKEADGKWQLSDENNFNWVRSYKVQPVCTLNVHKLNALDIQGAASLEFIDTVYTDKVDIVMNSVENQKLLFYCGNLYGSSINTGHTVFAGQGNIFAWSCENGSSFDGEYLRTSDAYVYHYTVRDVKVNAKNVLKANVYGSGNVYYFRDPVNKIEKNEFGKGRVIKR